MRKGQLEALEPVVIVIILAFVIGLLLLFTARIADRESGQDALLDDSREATVLVKQLAGMPELACGASTTKDTFCIDAQKAEMFSTTDPGVYLSLLSGTNVTITAIDLSTGEASEIRIYGGVRTSEFRTSTVSFTLHDPLTDEMRFATMTVVREVG